MTRRTEQLASTLKKAISAVLARGLSDPRVSGLCSVTQVELSDDLREAKVFVSVIPEPRQKLAIQGLEAAAGYIRRELDRYVELRVTPHLRFVADDSLKQHAEVDRAIAQGMARERAAGADDPTHGDPE